MNCTINTQPITKGQLHDKLIKNLILLHSHIILYERISLLNLMFFISFFAEAGMKLLTSL
jgi:hypothetical protein